MKSALAGATPTSQPYDTAWRNAQSCLNNLVLPFLDSLGLALVLDSRGDRCLCSAKVQLADDKFGVSLVGLPFEAVLLPTDHPAQDPEFLDLTFVRSKDLRLDLELLGQCLIEPLQVLLGSLHGKVAPFSKPSLSRTAVYDTARL